jgi:DNA polymerase III delta prime subunit
MNITETDITNNDVGESMERPLKRQQQQHIFVVITPEEAAAAAKLFPDTSLYQQFDELRRASAYTVNDLFYTLPRHTFNERYAIVEARELSDAAIFEALAARKAAMETTHELVSAQKVQDSMLQLYRLLCRRKIAVLQGQKLPAMGSFFARNR